MITRSQTEKFAALDHSEGDSALAPHGLQGLPAEISNVVEPANVVQNHPEGISAIGISALGEESNIVNNAPFGEDEEIYSGDRSSYLVKQEPSFLAADTSEFMVKRI
ncbi:hypothetical protein RUND412_001454 [Rhizina undulata]